MPRNMEKPGRILTLTALASFAGLASAQIPCGLTECTVGAQLCGALNLCVPLIPGVTCGVESDCTGSLSVCLLGLCIGDTIDDITCGEDADCPEDLPNCTGGLCLPDTPITCDEDIDCPALLATCSPEGLCIPDTPVTCGEDADCPEDLPNCTAGVCIPDTPVTCDEDADCPDLLPICNDAGICVPETPVTCDEDADCPDLLPVCGPLGVCLPGEPPVGCGSDEDCTDPEQPVCDPELAICVPADDDTTTTATDDATATEEPTGTDSITTGETIATETDDDNATEPTGTETDDGDNTSAGTATQVDDSETGTTDTETAAPTETGDNPPTVGDFRLLGCYSSDEGFPGFSTEETSDDMDLDLCAEQCNGENYFGVHRKECFCGTDLEGMVSTDLDRCDIVCPGDDSEFCGGDVTPNRRLLRRQDISNNILLSVYVAVGFVPEGDDTTVTTTFVSTVTGDAGPVVTTVTTAVVCGGGICGGGPSGPVFIFNIFTCQECAGEEVYFANSCSCVGGVEYVPHVCDETSCVGKTVYKPEEKPFGGSSQVYYPTPCNSGDCGTGSMFKPYRKGQADYTVPTSPAGSGDNVKGPHDGGDQGADSGSKGNDAGADSDNGGAGAGGPGKDDEPVLVSLGDKQMATTLALVVLLPVAGALAGWV